MVTGSNTETLNYNASGAIKSRTLGNETTEYTYDGAGRLIRVEQDNNTIAEYTYDGDGRLVRIIEHLPGGTRTTIRLPLGTETAYEHILEGTDEIEHIYIRANGMYIARETRVNGGPPQVSYYHGDHLGSTRAVSGIGDATLTYDPFGQLIESSGNDAEHLHRFTGKPQDSTGLYYYYARFYDPTISRFISQDPAMDGLNWYAYAAGNPLKFVDPDGQRSRYRVFESSWKGTSWSVYSYATWDKVLNGIFSFIPLYDAASTWNDMSVNAVPTVGWDDVGKSVGVDLISFGVGKVLGKLAQGGNELAGSLLKIQLGIEGGLVLRGIPRRQHDELGLRILANLFDGQSGCVCAGFWEAGSEYKFRTYIPAESNVSREELLAALLAIEALIQGKSVYDPDGHFERAYEQALREMK